MFQNKPFDALCKPHLHIALHFIVTLNVGSKQIKEFHV